MVSFETLLLNRDLPGVGARALLIQYRKRERNSYNDANQRPTFSATPMHIDKALLYMQYFTHTHIH